MPVNRFFVVLPRRHIQQNDNLRKDTQHTNAPFIRVNLNLCFVMLNVIMLNVIVLNVIVLNVTVLNVIVLNVIVLNFILLNVILTNVT